MEICILKSTECAKRSFLSEKTVREKSRLAPAHVYHEIYTWEYIGVMLYIFISL